MSDMKRRSNSFIRFILRIDNINRILVIVSRIFFITLPSYILYYLKDEQNWKEIVIPCLIRLASALGNGCLCLYRPRRSTFLYFYERACILLIRFIHQAPFGRHLSISVFPILVTFITYCFLGRFINAVFYRYYRRKRTFFGKNARKEGTNGDTAFDFLNAAPVNKKIEEDLESIPEGEARRRRKAIKRTKLSKFRRAIGFLIARTRFVLSIAKAKHSFDLTVQISLLGLLVVPFYFLGSLWFPRHFKYGFFFNGRILRILDYLTFDFSGRPSGLNFFCILFRILFGITFLVCLIVEGRTWTGAPEDY